MQTKTAGLQVDLWYAPFRRKWAFLPRRNGFSFSELSRLMGHCILSLFIPKQLSSETQTTAIWKEKMRKNKTIVSFFFQMVYMYFLHFCIWHFLLFFNKIKLCVCYRVSRFKRHGLDGKHLGKKTFSPRSALNIEKVEKWFESFVWSPVKKKRGQRYYNNLPRSKIKFNKRNFAFYDS